EIEQENASRINQEAVAVMAKIAAAGNALLVHYSTDYIFDGTKTNAYIESDIPNPLSVYGTSKLLGEIAIRDSGCAHLIFRTSWVFSTYGANFAKTMLRLASTQEKLRVICDQWGAPTSAELIADVTAHVLRNTQEKCHGTYHLAASGETNWYEYARFVIQRAIELGAEVKVQAIEPISTSEYPLPATRPANSRLNCAKLQKAFDLSMPHWQYHANRMLVELTTR
ncbi:MAG TPA: dTDP-4-dehydrorhamnose reductase, partial [Spongiibacteraceae bacterium]|nr:dTDP-4-dehydrorhamnose reductase [Spongiibacteraceae bacterium]